MAKICDINNYYDICVKPGDWVKTKSDLFDHYDRLKPNHYYKVVSIEESEGAELCVDIEHKFPSYSGTEGWNLYAWFDEYVPGSQLMDLIYG